MMNPVRVLPLRTGLHGGDPLFSASFADGPSRVFFLLRFFREVGVAHRSARYLMRDTTYDQLGHGAIDALRNTCRLEQAAASGPWVRYGSKKLQGEKSGQLADKGEENRSLQPGIDAELFSLFKAAA